MTVVAKFETDEVTSTAALLVTSAVPDPVTAAFISSAKGSLMLIGVHSPLANFGSAILFLNKENPTPPVIHAAYVPKILGSFQLLYNKVQSHQITKLSRTEQI
mmetsp:Transcript_28472/g.65139  ORF Transcript_28472/g.65139 Transcript_28472/m.65139 type:complete len:103 (+) Transcript_28472:157-465(+)